MSTIKKLLPLCVLTVLVSTVSVSAQTYTIDTTKISNTNTSDDEPARARTTQDSTGDPDSPVITGQVPTTQGTSIDPDEIDVQVDGTQTAGIEPDEIDVALEATAVVIVSGDTTDTVTGGQTPQRAGYLKIGDIKGESTEAKKGNVEYNWKVEEGESAAAKPMIVVVESETTDQSAPKLLQSNCQGANLICEPQDVKTDDDLKEFIERLVNEYDELDQATVGEAEITLKTRQPAKLFGFIPFSIAQTVTINTKSDTFGNVKVKFPWWHVLTKKSIAAADLVEQIQGAISSAEVSFYASPPAMAQSGDEDEEPKPMPTEQISLNFEEIKATLLDTALSVIRKIGS